MTIPSWARVGAQVVCINDEWDITEAEGITRVPMLNEILTIEGAFMYRDFLALNFVELPVEYGFDVDGFRPLQTLRRDVRLVKSLVRDMPAETRLDRLAEMLDDA